MQIARSFNRFLGGFAREFAKCIGINMKRIVLTGGGTAGHVTPNMALVPALKEEEFEIHYIGSYDGMEKKLIEEMKIPYHGISSGKLRRYFDVKNFSDPLKVVKGYKEALNLMKTLKPDVVFSKGGFVTVPVVLAAKAKGIPVVIHESDMTPGLANKIAIPCAKKVCCNFPEAAEHIGKNKALVTGTPIRRELFLGNSKKGLEICGFKENKPVIMIVGGSSGSKVINEVIRENLDFLLKDFQAIHLCGKGNLDESKKNLDGYMQMEYAKSELPHLLKLSDMVISRAGANAICELLALNKPNILIPLSAKASRGDQILNAKSFEKQGFSYVIEEEEFSKETLDAAVKNVFENKKTYEDAMKKSTEEDSIEIIIDLLKSLAK